MAVPLQRTECRDAGLDRAFRLAYYIHRDKETAIRIAAAAITRLETTAAAQDKRLYYTPTGRPLSDRLKSNGFRNKVTLDSLDLLQLLVFIESEPYERLREADADSRHIGEDDLVVHFIKHLVTVTMKRNSFYVALGICRLLYNYSTSETMDIYTVILQDPDRTKDDHYYRSRKGRLMQEMKQRFGGLLSASRGPHGEERFRGLEHPGRYAGLVKECLSLFSPWRAFCPVPAGFNPTSDLLAGLSSDGHIIDEDHLAEVNRIHAILHPDCFTRLTQGLAFDSPDSRLALPHFFLSDRNGNGNGDKPRSDRRHPPELEVADQLDIKRFLDDQAARRRALSGRMFRVRIDGVERASIDLARSNSVRIEVDASADMIEVIGSDSRGEFLLATHLLSFNDVYPRQAALYTTRLEAGGEISFHFEPEESGRRSTSIDVRYNALSQLSLVRRSPLWPWISLQRLISETTARFRQRRPVVLDALGAAWVVGIIALLIGAALLYLQSRRGPVAPTPVVESSVPAPAGAEDVAPSLPNPKPNATAKPRIRGLARVQKGASASSAPSPPANDPSLTSNETDATRDIDSNFSRASLAEVRLVYVESRGEEPISDQLRLAFISAIRASTIFQIAEPDRADAAIKLLATPVSTAGARELGVVRIRMQLVNAAGDVIWQASKTIGGDKRPLPATEIASEMLRDLESRVRELKPVRR